jgi:hypothetical protein
MVPAIILLWHQNSVAAQLTRAQAAIELIAYKGAVKFGAGLRRSALAAEHRRLLVAARSRIRGAARRIP